jgi:hypothetical protein
MQKKSLNFVRLFCGILLSAMCLFQNAWAERVANAQSVKEFFRVTNAALITEQAVNALAAPRLKEWQDETDPEKKARMKASFELTDKIIRKHIQWSKIEPLAIASFMKSLQENEVNQLIVYYRSPIGRIRVEKLAPAIIQGLPNVFAYLDKRIDEIVDREPGQTPAERTLPAQIPKVASRSIDKAALAMIMSMPDMKSEFRDRMSNIETNIAKNMELLLGENAGAVESVEIKRLVAAIQNEITFDDVAQLFAATIADHLSESEILLLTEDNKDVQVIAHLSKMRKVNADLQVLLNDYLQKKILPELIPQLLQVLEKK